MPAKILKGKRITFNPGLRDNAENTIRVDKPVVIDGKMGLQSSSAGFVPL